ncbi:MAG: hypothetical protein GX786_07305, partial [Clostridiales bacterium]|nr:hypothetical protein [Clostridiales bacterium]
MKTMEEALKEARKALEEMTPLYRNCGSLCEGACCKDEQGGENGMLLFPGEEKYYQGIS